MKSSVGRHREIVAMLHENGRIDVATVAQRFNITLETVRRDLVSLEHDGLVLRVHGGAVLGERGLRLPHRVSVRSAEKDAISRAAMAHRRTACGASPLVLLTEINKVWWEWFENALVDARNGT